MSAYSSYDPEQLTLSDFVNWPALDAVAMYYHNWLAALRPEECSLPVMYSILFVVVTMLYLLEKLELSVSAEYLPASQRDGAEQKKSSGAPAKIEAKTSGTQKAPVPTPTKCREPGARIHVLVAVAVVVALAGMLHESLPVFDRNKSVVERTCAPYAQGSIERERCVNETSEYATGTRNWSPLDSGRNFTRPRPSMRDLIPSVACIEPLTMRPFDEEGVTECSTFLENGGTLPIGGVVNAKMFTDNTHFDMPYIPVVLEITRRARLQVRP